MYLGHRDEDKGSFYSFLEFDLKRFLGFRFVKSKKNNYTYYVIDDNNQIVSYNCDEFLKIFMKLSGLSFKRLKMAILNRKMIHGTFSLDKYYYGRITRYLMYDDVDHVNGIEIMSSIIDLHGCYIIQILDKFFLTNINLIGHVLELGCVTSHSFVIKARNYDVNVNESWYFVVDTIDGSIIIKDVSDGCEVVDLKDFKISDINLIQAFLDAMTLIEEVEVRNKIIEYMDKGKYTKIMLIAG